MLSLKKLLIVTLLFICLPGFVLAQNGYWFDRADMPSSRQEILPAELDGKIYVIGGWPDGSSITDLVEVYDPLNDSWSTVEPFPYPIHHCALASVNGTLYVVGGYFNVGAPWNGSREIWTYDSSTDEWNFKTLLNVGRGEHNIAVYQDKIYVVGGKTFGGVETAVVEVYDPVANTCNILDSLPTLRHHHAMAVVDTLIYVVGGRYGVWGDYTNINAVEAYSPASDTWYTITNMPKPRGGLSAIGIDDKLYIFGGEIPGIFSEVEVYDPATDIWTELTPMLTPRHGTAAVMVEDTVFIIGGSSCEMMCPENANQGFVLGVCTDSDHDGYGDTDDPNNTCPCPDNCPEIFNPIQEDTDSDGVGDNCDGCPNNFNPNQLDTDTDQVMDSCDNCPEVYNPDQTDENEDGIGDVCEWICGDCTDNGTVNILDVTYLIAYLYNGGPTPNPLEAADVNNSGNINILDITYLIAYLYNDGLEPNCS